MPLLRGPYNARPPAGAAPHSGGRRRKRAGLELLLRNPLFFLIFAVRVSQKFCRATPANTARELSRAALDILERSWKSGAPIRALTLTAHNLIPEGEAAEQLDLFQSGAPQKRQRIETLERTMDAIRAKYGRDAVTVAALAPEPEAEQDGDVPF